MLDTALSVGGVVRQSSQLNSWDLYALRVSGVASSERAEVSLQDTARRKVTLSTVHNSPLPVKTQKPSTALFRGGSAWESPKVTWYSGASFLKVSRAKQTKEEKEEKEISKDKNKKEDKEKEISKRGNCKGYTSGVRLRHKRELSKYRRDTLPNFVTLTYPNEYSYNPEIWKRDLDTFIKRLKRAFPMVSGNWVLQPQERQAPHFHILIWGVSLSDLQSFIPLAWYEVVGSGDLKHLLFHEGKYNNKHCVEVARSWNDVSCYASKYVSKGFAGFDNVGRVWGVFGRKYLPYGEKIEKNITDRKAVEFIRYEKRFSFSAPKGIGGFMSQRERQKVKASRRSRKRSYRSLTIICNPDLWICKVLFSC